MNSKNSGKMRILDVLTDHDQDDEDVDVINGGSDRSFISRWLAKYSLKGLKRSKEKKKAGSGTSSGLDAASCPDPTASSVDAAAEPPSDSEARKNSGDCGDSVRKCEDFSLNFGMGVGMVLLLAKSATEFNKMMGLRAEMEMLLKEIKHEVRRKDVITSSSESNVNFSVSPSRCCEGINTSKIVSLPNSSACFALQKAKCDVESDRGSKHTTSSADARSLNIEKMEAELEVELERLQHNLKEEGPSVPQIEVDCENDDVSSSEDYDVNCEDEDVPDDDYMYEGVNCEEEDVPVDEDYIYEGVCAYELESRLHELLQSRQQEKIAELESALECAQQKLREKDMELQWWKETQLVASLNMEKANI